MTKTKIVVDADVIIHFAKGGYLGILPTIFETYEYIILDKVYNEIKGTIKTQLDNQILLLKNIMVTAFPMNMEIMKEYARLTLNLGQGESACLAYCRYNNDVIGSSNLKDIEDYCYTHKLTYITTLDFLYYAIKKKIMTIEQANIFIADVITKGSKLPKVDMATYVSKTIL